ncbi:hypothetical protein PS2_027578 [Malus domestica]
MPMLFFHRPEEESCKSFFLSQNPMSHPSEYPFRKGLVQERIFLPTYTAGKSIRWILRKGLVQVLPVKRTVSWNYKQAYLNGLCTSLVQTAVTSFRCLRIWGTKFERRLTWNLLPAV